MAQDNYAARKKVYDFMSSRYNMGDEETFMKNFDDPEKRRKIYEKMSESYNMGDFDTFSSKMGYGSDNGVGSQSEAATKQVQNNIVGEDDGYTVHEATDEEMDSIRNTSAQTPERQADQRSVEMAQHMARPYDANYNYYKPKDLNIISFEDFRDAYDIAQRELETNVAAGMPLSYKEYNDKANDLTYAQHPAMMIEDPDALSDDEFVSEYSKTNGHAFRLMWGDKVSPKTVELNGKGITFDQEAQLRSLLSSAQAAYGNENADYAAALEAYQTAANSLLGEGGADKFAQYIQNDVITNLESDLDQKIVDNDELFKNAPSDIGPLDYVWYSGVINSQTVASAMTPRTSVKIGDKSKYQMAGQMLNDAKQHLDEYKIEQKDMEGQGELAREYLPSATAICRGVKNVVTSLSTWDFGVSDAITYGTLLDAVNKYENGDELSDGDIAILDAAATKLAIEANVRLNGSYKAGEITGEMLPFMLEIMISPYSKAGETVATKVARYALKKQFGKVSTKLLVGGARITADALIGGVGQASTTGMMKTASAIEQRRIGDIQYNVDDDGRIVYDGSVGREDVTEAFWKGLATQSIEYQSELVGEYFRPLSRVLGKDFYRNLYGTMIGVGDGALHAIVRNTRKVTSTIGREAKFNGWVGETAEEIVGGLENYMIGTSDQALFDGTEENPGILSWDNISETALMMLPAQVMFVLLPVGASAVNYSVESSKARYRVITANSNASSLLGKDRWINLKNEIDAAEGGKIVDVVKEITSTLELSNDQKMAIAHYAIALQAKKGADMARGVARNHNINQMVYGGQYDRGMEMNDPKELSDWCAISQHDQQALKDSGIENFSMWVNAIMSDPVDAIERMYRNAVDYRGNVHITAEQIAAAEQFASTCQVIRGAMDRLSTESMQKRSDFEADVKASTHKDGQLHPVQLMDGRTAYVITGNVATLPDGSIDRTSSDGVVICYVDGNQEAVGVTNIQSVGALQDPSKAIKANAAQLDADNKEAWKNLYFGTVAPEIGGQAEVWYYGNVVSGTVEDFDLETGLYTISTEDGGMVQASQQELQNAADYARGERVGLMLNNRIGSIDNSEVSQDENAQVDVQHDQEHDDEAAQEPVDAPAAPIEEEKQKPTGFYMKWHDDEDNVHTGIGSIGLDGYWHIIDDADGKEVLIDTSDEDVEIQGEVDPDQSASAEQPVMNAPEAEVPSEPSQPVFEEMPFDKNGVPVWHKVTPEQAAQWLAKESGLSLEDALQFAKNKLSEAYKEKEKLDGKEVVMGTDLKKYQKEKKDHEMASSRANGQFAFWDNVIRQVKSLQIDEYQSMQKSEAQEAADKAHQKRAKMTPAKRIAAIEQAGLSADYPTTALEAVLWKVASGQMKLTSESILNEVGSNHSIVSDGFKGKVKTAEKGGVTVARLAESIAEDSEGRLDEQEVRDAVIDCMSMTREEALTELEKMSGLWAADEMAGQAAIDEAMMAAEGVGENTGAPIDAPEYSGNDFGSGVSEDPFAGAAPVDAPFSISEDGLQEQQSVDEVLGMAEWQDRIRQIENVFGVTIEAVDGLEEGENGQYDRKSKTIRINRNLPINTAIGWVIGHELTHRMKDISGGYEKYLDSVSEYWGTNNFMKLVQDRISLYAKHGVKLSVSDAMEEVAADFGGSLLKDGKLMRNYMLRADMDLKEKIVSTLKDIVAKIRKVLKEGGLSEIDRSVIAMEKFIKGAQKGAAEEYKKGISHDAEQKENSESQTSGVDIQENKTEEPVSEDRNSEENQKAGEDAESNDTEYETSDDADRKKKEYEDNLAANRSFFESEGYEQQNVEIKPGSVVHYMKNGRWSKGTLSGPYATVGGIRYQVDGTSDFFSKEALESWGETWNSAVNAELSSQAVDRFNKHIEEKYGTGETRHSFYDMSSFVMRKSRSAVRNFENAAYSLIGQMNLDGTKVTVENMFDTLYKIGSYYNRERIGIMTGLNIMVERDRNGERRGATYANTFGNSLVVDSIEDDEIVGYSDDSVLDDHKSTKSPIYARDFYRVQREGMKPLDESYLKVLNMLNADESAKKYVDSKIDVVSREIDKMDTLVRDVPEGPAEEGADYGDDVRYSIVNEENANPYDMKVMQEIADGKVETVYRSMQVVDIDGKRYALPPMASKIDGKWVQGVEILDDGMLEPVLLRADEHPELAKNGKFYLDKGNGKGLWAAYNPYWHVSPKTEGSSGMLNDQFAEAQDRNNLITVEGVVPSSELESGYKADKAKDAVGAHDWKAGIIAGQLTGTRRVILSRYFQGMRVVPDAEVAQNIFNDINGNVEVMPSNVVPVGVRAELEKLGVKFVETDNMNQLKDGEHAGDRYTWWFGKNQEKNRRKAFREKAIGEYMHLADWLEKEGRTGQIDAKYVDKADKNIDSAIDKKKAEDAKKAEEEKHGNIRHSFSNENTKNNDLRENNEGNSLQNGKKSLSLQRENEAYKAYMTPEKRAEYEDLGRKMGFKVPELSFISFASRDGIVIPYDVLMDIPEIKAAQDQVDALTESDHLSLKKNEIKQYADRLTENYGSAVRDENTGKYRYDGEVEKGKKLFIVIGRPAGGKSSVFADPLSEKNKARLIDSDEAKKMLPGFEGAIGASIVNNASSKVADKALRDAISRGDNIVMPRIGGLSVIDFAIDAKNAGYDVNIYYNDIPVGNSIMRSAARYAETGRYLDLHYLLSIGEKPYETLETYFNLTAYEAGRERDREKARKRAERLNEDGSRFAGREYEPGRVRRNREQLNPGEDLLFDHIEWADNNVPYKSPYKVVWNSDSGDPLPDNVSHSFTDVTVTDNFKRWFGDWENDPEHASKVVDADGSPLVLSHGTPLYGFTVFNTRRNPRGEITMGSHFGSRQAAQDRIDKMGSRAFTTKEGIYDVYLDIKNPWECSDWFDQDDPWIITDLAKLALENKDNPIVQKYWNYVKNFEDWTKDYTDEQLANGEHMAKVNGLVAYEYDDLGALYNFVRPMIQSSGHDGIKYWNDVEGNGYSWVVFSPEQIKSAETSGEMANNGEFDPNNPDIRYSIGESSRTMYDASKMFERIAENDATDEESDEAVFNVNDIRHSILKEPDMRTLSQAYFNRYFVDDRKKRDRLAPLSRSGMTQQLLDDCNQVIDEAVNMMRPYLDAVHEGKRYLPEEVYGLSTIFDNSSYGKTVENTLICFRTLAYNDFCDELKRRIGRPLTVRESFLASQMLYDIATEPQCLYCYVSLDRKAYDEYLLNYMKDRDAVIDKFNALKNKNAKNIVKLYTEFLDGRKDTPNMKLRFASWLQIAEDGNAITNADLATEESRNHVKYESEDAPGWDEVQKKYNRLKKQDKIDYRKSQEYQNALIRHMATRGGQVKDAESYAQSASWAKKPAQYRSYTGELLKASASGLKGVMGQYGLRFYSFSEYSPAFIVENMQQVRDAALRGMKTFAYTKKTDFARIFATTGMNINVSTFGRVDSDGNVVMDTNQGADWNEVKELREKYPNVAAVFVATNDDMVNWALDQDWIDVIIPFHIVRTGQSVADFYKWINYTSESADYDINGRHADIYPHEHHNEKDTYMKLVQERGITPRFSRFVDHPNYMRLVNETRRSAEETPLTLPVFDMESARNSWDQFVEDGGYYSNYFFSDEAFEEGINQVQADIEAGREANEVDYGRQDMPIDYAERLSKIRNKHRAHGNTPLTRHSFSEDQTKSDSFKKWFGDWENDPEHASKAVNPDGTPKVFYHGSIWDPNNEAPGKAVFNDDAIGSASGDGGFFGRGHYFAFTEPEAGYYGPNVTKAYLDIKKPFYFNETIYRNWEGKEIGIGDESQSAGILNMVKNFPDVIDNLEISAYDDFGEEYNEIVTVYDYADIFEKTYKEKKFEIERNVDPRDSNIIKIKADPVRLKAANGYEWTEYGFEMNMYEPSEGEDRQFTFTHYYLTHMSDTHPYLDDDIKVVSGEAKRHVMYGIPRFGSVFESNEFREALEKKGYDGVFQSKDGDEAVVFRSNQIKSVTDNNGNFDGNNPDIRYSIRDDASAMDLYDSMSERQRRQVADDASGMNWNFPDAVRSYVSNHEDEFAEDGGASAEYEVMDKVSDQAVKSDVKYSFSADPAAPEIDNLREANKEIAKLRRMVDRIKTRQKTIDDVRREVYNAVSSNLSPEAGLQMNSTQILGILAQIRNANSVSQLDVILGTIDEIISKTQLKADMIRFEHYLNVKVQGQTTRGIAKGLLVDSDTAKILNEVRATYKALKVTFLDERLKGVRRDIRAVNAEIREKQESGESVDELNEKLENLQQERADLEEQKSYVSEANAADEVNTLIELEEANSTKIDDLMAEGKEIPSELLSFKVSLPIRIKLAQMREDRAAMDVLANEYANAIQKAENSADWQEHDNWIEEAARIKALQNSTRKRLIHEVRDCANELKDLIDNGAEKRSARIREEMEHRKEIISMGVEAVRKNPLRNPVIPEGEKDDKKKSRATFSNRLSAPAQSFNHVLKVIDVNHGEGNSPLYDYFMKGKNGAVESNDRYTDGVKEFASRIDDKCQEIFGKSLKKLMKECSKPVDNVPIPTVMPMDTKHGNPGDVVITHLTKGQALYVWLTWRQNAGRDKLEAMGFTPECIDIIKYDILGTDMMKFGAWISDEFLVEMRDDKYSPVHERVYGTPLNKTLHYFPLKINKTEIVDKDEIGERSPEGAFGSSASNIIMRKDNNLPIEVSTDAFEALLEYGSSMERFSAMAELQRDLTILSKSKAFRNLMEANRPGMYDIFKNAAQVCVGTYQAKTNMYSEFLGKVQSSFMQQAIGFRWYTALKQTLSYPAFWAYSGNLSFQRKIHGYFFTPWINYKWAVENLPSFRQRIEKGDFGIEGLSDKTFMDAISGKISRWGMWANKSVDALTVAAGARAVYEYQLEQYLSRGMDESEAKRQARIDAEICFNESQQSSRPEFSAPAQKDKDLISRALNAFQNSNIGYRRAIIEGWNDVTRASDLYKRGKIGKDEKNDLVWKGIRKLMTFGIILPGLWQFGIDPSIIFGQGDDDDEDWAKKKSEWWTDMVFAVLEGMFTNGVNGGPFFSSSIEMAKNKTLKDKPGVTDEYNPTQGLVMIQQSINDVIKESKDGDFFGIATTVATRTSKVMGVDPVTFSNMALGVWDAVESGDPSIIDMMLILNMAKSKRTEFVQRYYSDLSSEELAEKMTRAMGLWPKYDDLGDRDMENVDKKL